MLTGTNRHREMIDGQISSHEVGVATVQEQIQMTEAVRRWLPARIKDALDDLGYPASHQDRARALSAALAIDVGSAGQLLAGDMFPEMADLFALCELTKREPGFFLDATHQEFPNETCLVTAIGIGDPIALTLLPSFSQQTSARGELRYYLAKHPCGFGIRAGDLLIVEAATEGSEFQPDWLYLFSGRDGIEVRKCVDVTDGRAKFTSQSEVTVPYIVPISKQRHDRDMSSEIFQVIATLIAGSGLHTRTQ